MRLAINGGQKLCMHNKVTLFLGINEFHRLADELTRVFGM